MIVSQLPISDALLFVFHSVETFLLLVIAFLLLLSRRD